MNVYLDAAATTPLYPDVAKEMYDCFSEDFYNSSATYAQASLSKSKLVTARSLIAKSLNVKMSEILFTSSGSESNNMVIKGFASKFALTYPGKKPCIVTTKIEHSSVLKACEYLEHHNYADVYYLSVDSEGFVSYEELSAVLRENIGRCLVSVMFANNEIGTVQDIKVLSQLAHKYGALFHTDAVQAYGHMPINLGLEAYSCVDFLSASGHKFNGPKGTGFLYVKKKCLSCIDSLVSGGSQEQGLRGGTYNTPGIYGLGLAAEKSVTLLEDVYDDCKAMQMYFYSRLKEAIPDIILNGPSLESGKRVVNSLNITFPSMTDKQSEQFLYALSLQGVVCSSGSACSSNKPSHVLQAIGLVSYLIERTLRFSFCCDMLTYDSLDYAVSVIFQYLMQS